MTNWTHYVYNSQGRCLAGVVMDEVHALPDEVVAEYLAKSGGLLSLPVVVEDGAAHFGERVRDRSYNRYAVVACRGEWP